MASLSGCADSDAGSAGFVAEKLADFAGEYQEALRRDDDIIAECMTTEGFAYQSENRASAAEEDNENTFVMSESILPSEEVIDLEGYGFVVTGLARSRGESAPKLSPNDLYRLSLLASGQEAFDVALEACRSRAKVASELNAGQGSQLSDLIRRVDGLVRTDPEVVDAIDSWSRCMADAGWSFRTPGDPQRAVVEAYNELAARETGDRIGLATDGLAPRNPIDEVSLKSHDSLMSLGVAEIELAQADLGCQNTGFREAVQRSTARAEDSVRQLTLGDE